MTQEEKQEFKRLTIQFLFSIALSIIITAIIMALIIC